MLHRAQRRVYPAPARRQALVRDQQDASAQRLGQDQRVASAQAAFAQHADQVFIHQAVDGKAQRQLLALAAVAADQTAAGRVQHLDRALHQRVQQLLGLALQARWNCRDRGGGLWRGSHGKQVAQRMVGGDAAKAVRVVDEGAKEIHALHQRLASRHAHDGCIIGRA